MKFREWLKLQEVGTGTNAIAVFARPVIGGPVTRNALDSIGFQEVPFKKMSKRKKKMLEEAGWRFGDASDFLDDIM